ncbi:hypothetical protein GE061_007600 [Apolygus lucorum]|uniref:C2H2-type domain-containing protein n=1 Tax=Apolygus lucorum TaxID=248454 RepID=A0A8S9WTN1_APOLU|nr:hypothetical protein GE061_007600 [Apolygus lucorum]
MYVMEVLQCDLCYKTFGKQDTLRKHKSRSHPPPDRPPPELLSCNNCKFTTIYKYNLATHMKKHARPRKEKVGAQLKACGLCNTFQSIDRAEVINHYQDSHEVKITEETLFFSNDEQVEAWKRGVESAECCKFIIRGGIRKRRNAVVNYLFCFRDGCYKPGKGTGKRKMKVTGSCKIGSVCPASIRMVKNTTTGEITVKYIARHVGHRSDLFRKNLTKEEKDSIATKLAAGVPISSILDSIRDSIPFNGEVSRIHLITRKDVWNIRASLQLPNDTVKQDDRSSVESWLDSLANYSKVVQFYKRQSAQLFSHHEINEEDFILILVLPCQVETLQKFGNGCVCFDRTTNTAYSFELTTLLVQDDQQCALPCGYMISNRSDCHFIRLFLEIIKDLLKHPISPKVLLSDTSDMYFNAWNTVMPSPVRWLYCSWRVDQSWKQHLNQVSDATKRDSTYKLLRSMADEPDKDAFYILFEGVKRIIYNDPDLLDFAEHFNREYAGNVERWAFFCQKDCSIGANMLQESMQEVLKWYNLNGKKVKTIGRGLSALLKFTKEKIIGKVAEKSIKLSPELVAIRGAHEKSTTLKSKLIPIQCGYMISSESDDSDLYYIVTRLRVICSCALRCDSCGICEHEYSCTCPDTDKSIICEHVHRIATYEKDKRAANQDSSDGEFYVADDFEECFESSDTVQSSENKLEEEKSAFISELTSLVESVTNIAQLEVIKKAFASVPQTVKALEPSFTSTNECT